jgi:hypothetical protein
LRQRPKEIRARGKGGAALVTAVIFVFFLTLFGLAYYRLGETDIDLFGYEKNLSKALYASEAGIEKVKWMLRESHQIPSANPFKSTYVETTALSIANPTSGDFFPGEQGKAYFKVTEITAELLPTGLPGSRVKIQTFGSVDVNADGEAGLTPIGAGKFAPDPDDVTRSFEAYIGLPGTLGERIDGKGISAGAGAFYDSSAGVEVSLYSAARLFVTPDGDTLNGFLYFGSGAVGNWDQWGFIFSNPAKTGEVELPRGIFDEDGDYIDDDNNGIPDYFQDLDLRIYTGNQIFTPDPDNDPTAGAEGRRVIYVNGDITIRGVDFGYLSDEGGIRSCDWEKAKTDPAFADLTFIANGEITVDRVDCGNVGRLVLVGKDIELVGDYNTKINGIAIAFNDITLNGSGCTDGILTHQTDFSRPVRYAAYFLGSMVAGNRINLQDDGWAVIYDENVINGKMYSTTVSKPTLTYERAEAEDFNSSNNWRLTESPTPELAYIQGRYTQDEIGTMQGDYVDGGVDELPELMRVYTDREKWHPEHYPAIGETLRLDFTTGDFEDPIPDFSRQNWEYYDAITFWMALDNFKRTSTDGTKTTRREAKYVFRLRDAVGTPISAPLETLYPESQWGTVRYHHVPGGGLPEEYTNEIRDLTSGEKANGETYSGWKRVKISLNNPDDSDFDFSRVERFDIRYSYLKVSWTVDPIKADAYVEWSGSLFQYVDENMVFGSPLDKLEQGDLINDPPAHDGYNYLYDKKHTAWIRWFEDPNSSTDVRMREEVLMPTLRIDRIELPGKPAGNTYLEYGLPHSLRLDVTNWLEL